MRRIGYVLLLALASLLSTPDGFAASKKPKTHTVYPGQTLGGIAKRYNVELDALCKANGIKRKAPIRPKQRLVIPLKSDKDGTETAALVRKLEQEARENDAKPEKKVSAAKTRAEKREGAKRAAEKQSTKADGGRSTKAKRSAKTNSNKTNSKKANSKKQEPTYAKRPRRKGYLTLSGTVGSWKGVGVDRKGRVPKKAADGVAKVLASWRTGQREDIHKRLIRMLVRVSDHFGGRPVRVVSGYRPYRAGQYTAHSRHNEGSAVDFFIPGVPNEAIRDYCRTLPNVGVGYYPNSTFVHLDVREVRTYWIDYSGPGEAPRYANAGGKDPGPAAPTPAPKPEAEPEPEPAKTEAEASEERDARKSKAQPERG